MMSVRGSFRGAYQFAIDKLSDLESFGDDDEDREGHVFGGGEKSAWEAHADVGVRHLPATYVPDVIIQLAHEGKADTFPHLKEGLCVAFFTDVSGFTAVTERYSLRGNKGLEDLTKTISDYIGSLVAIILNSGGDVIKFAGDAFLSIWPTNDETDLPIHMNKALQCAIKIQREWAEWPTAVDYTLTVKIGIACGPYTMSIFGITNIFAHYILTGGVVDDVKKAEKLCEGGQIVVSPFAWEYIKSDPSIDDIKKNRIQKDYVKLFARRSTSAMLQRSKIDVHRPALEGIRDAVLETLKLYLMPQVKAEEGDRFPEMRPVTIVFVCLPEVDAQDVHLLHKLFHHIFSAVQRLGGVLNKALFFDKGCTFLAVFGLPGFKRSNDCSSAVRCAGNIIGQMKGLSLKCSIGVTTGTCFCGNVGHPQRQEYTVFGAKVNMAARLMCIYEEINVSCDADTYYQSRMDLHESNFYLLPMRPLKGIVNPGDVYEYNWQAVSASTEDLPPPTMPLLGMTAEKRFLWVRMKFKQSARNLAGIVLTSQEMVVILTGMKGSGKTRILQWCLEQAKDMNFKTAGCIVKMTMKGATYATLRHLLMDLFELRGLQTNAQRQERIEELLGDDSKKMYLHLLNEVLDVEFPVKKIRGQKEVIQRTRNNLISILITRCGPDVMFGVSEAHRMDPATCEVLQHCLLSGHLMCIFDMTIMDRQVLQGEHFATEWALSRTSSIVNVGAFHNVYVAPYACYYLKVVAIHKDIVSLLSKHGHENPLWMQQLLNYLVDHKAVGFYPLESLSERMDDLDFWDLRVARELEDAKYSSSKFKKLIKWIYRLQSEEEFDSELRMEACVVVTDQGFEHFQVPSSVLEMVLQHVDSLTPEHRSILIKAALLGLSFEKDTLERIFPQKTDIELVAWIHTMKQLNILFCGIGYDKSMVYQAQEGLPTLDTERQIDCICSKLEMGPPGICLSPRFRMPAIPNTVKHFLTADTRIEWNREIAVTLEKSIEYKEIQCVSCQRTMYEFDVAEPRKDSTGSAKAREMPKEVSFESVKSVDVRACRCSHMKMVTHKILAEQWETLDCYGKAFIHYLTATEHAIDLQDYEIAQICASRAVLMMELIKKRVDPIPSDDLRLDEKIYEGRCERINGVVDMCVGKLDQAFIRVEKARSIFGGLAVSLSHKHLKKLVEKANQSKANWDEVIEVAKCLEAASQICLKLGEHDKAGRISMCSMHLLERIHPEFLDMVEVYIVVIEGNFVNLQDDSEARMNMENKAITYCKDRLNYTLHFSTKEMQAISKLFFVIFMQRLKKGDNEEAADIGMEAYAIAKGLRDTRMLLKILPPLAMTFIFLKSGERCTQILGVLRPTAAQVNSPIGMALYYSMTTDVIALQKHRVSGELIQDCRHFAMRKTVVRTNEEDVDLYLVASMANWSVYHGLSTEIQKYWFKMAGNEIKRCSLCTLWSLAGKLSLLDCRIQLLKNAGITSVRKIRDEKEDIKRNLENILSKEIRQFPIFVTRVNDMLIAAEVASLHQMEVMAWDED